MDISTGRSLGKLLCDCWGLTNVRSIRLACDIDGPAIVEAEIIVGLDGPGGEVETQLKKFKLVEDQESDG